MEEKKYEANSYIVKTGKDEYAIMTSDQRDDYYQKKGLGFILLIGIVLILWYFGATPSSFFMIVGLFIALVILHKVIFVIIGLGFLAFIGYLVFMIFFM